MKWAKVFPWLVALASVMIIVTFTPAIVTDPLVTAIAQMRINAAKTEKPLPVPPADVSQLPEQVPYQGGVKLQ